MKFGGLCGRCGHLLKPIYFKDEDLSIKKKNKDVGILRCSYLLCDNCGHKECVDDSFDLCLIDNKDM